MDFAKPVYVLVDRLALSPEIRSRLMDSIEICYREGHGEAILEFVPSADLASEPDSRCRNSAARTRRARARTTRLQRAIRLQEMRSVLPGAGAAAVLVQQSVRRVPALPGIRQHD